MPSEAPEKCPACGNDVYVSMSEDGSPWACVDPKCKYAHGPRQAPNTFSVQNKDEWRQCPECGLKIPNDSRQCPCKGAAG